MTEPVLSESAGRAGIAEVIRRDAAVSGGDAVLVRGVKVMRARERDSGDGRGPRRAGDELAQRV